MNLKCSATAVLHDPSILFLAGGLTFVQIGWALMWQLAAFGVAINKGAKVIVIEGTSFLLSECRDIPATGAVGSVARCACARTTAEGPLALATPGVCEDMGMFTTQISPVILFFLLISFFWGSLVSREGGREGRGFRVISHFMFLFYLTRFPSHPSIPLLPGGEESVVLLGFGDGGGLVV